MKIFGNFYEVILEYLKNIINICMKFPETFWENHT